MNDAKYKYKLAVRNTIKSYENKVSDELYDNLLEKNMSSFWKTWKSKLGAKPVHTTHVSGLSNDSDIAEMFACKFATISDSKNRNSEQKRDASLCTDGYSVTSNNDEISLFDVADVDNAVFNKLKRGKAAGIDGVSPEHILYAHPMIPVLLFT